MHACVRVGVCMHVNVPAPARPPCHTCRSLPARSASPWLSCIRSWRSSSFRPASLACSALTVSDSWPCGTGQYGTGLDTAVRYRARYCSAAQGKIIIIIIIIITEQHTQRYYRTPQNSTEEQI